MVPREGTKMQDEIRVSPEGDVVAIRNLKHRETDRLTWRATNGAYLTDKQVENWIPLNRRTEITLVATGEYEDALVVGAFFSEDEANKYIENRKEFATDEASVFQRTNLYPRNYN